MLKSELKRLISPSKNDKQVFVVTANSQGIPGIISAEQLIPVSGKELVLECCLCTETLVNLWENPLIMILVWNRIDDSGYQLEGRLLQMKDISEMDEDSQKRDLNGLSPQIRKYLLVEIKKVIKIKKMSHTEEVISSSGWFRYANRSIIFGIRPTSRN